MYKGKFNSNFVDYSISSIGWKLKQGSIAFFKLDATLHVEGIENTYYLARTVLAGNVYSSTELPITPHYHYQWITNGVEKIIFRISNSKNISSDKKKDDRIKKLLINVKYKNMKEICLQNIINDEEFFNKNLVCRLEFFNQKCEFPVSHINLHQNDARFQVESGPIILKRKEDLFPAFVFFNSETECQVVWGYPGLRGATEKLNTKPRFFINA